MSDSESITVKKKVRKSAFVEEEAEESDLDKRTSDSEGEEEQNEYVADDFVTTDVTEEEKGRRKRRRKRVLGDDEHEIDEDDQLLIEENMGDDGPRRKMKRVGEAAGETRDELMAELFGDTEEAPLGDAAQEPERRREESVHEEDYSEDEMADFIEDEEEEDQAGTDTKKRKQRRKLHGVSNTEITEAFKTFGTGALEDLFDSEEEELFPREKKTPAAGSRDDGDDDQGRKDAAEDEESAESLMAGEEDDEEDEQERDASQQQRKSARSEGAAASAAAKKPSSAALSKFSQVFEPAVLEAAHITSKDVELRAADVPERLHQRFGDRATPTTAELDAEAMWIYNEIFNRMGTVELRRDALFEAIHRVLNLLLISKVEVPYIALYLRDYYDSTLREEHLWQIEQLDEQWYDLHRKKIELAATLRRLNSSFVSDSLLELLSTGSSLETIEDVSSYIEFAINGQRAEDEGILERHNERGTATTAGNGAEAHQHAADGDVTTGVRHGHGHGQDQENSNLSQQEDQSGLSSMYGSTGTQQETGGATQVARTHRPKPAANQGPQLPMVRNAYTYGRKAGIRDFTKLWALNAADFGLNLSRGWEEMPVTDPGVYPHELAQEFVDPKYCPSADKVIELAKRMVGQEILHDPTVRAYFRKTFWSLAVVSTYPTARGLSEIDLYHPYGGIHKIREKPITDFLRESDTLRPTGEYRAPEQDPATMWFTMLKAEREGFIRIRITTQTARSSDEDIVKSSIKLLQSRNISHRANEWNSLRSLMFDEMWDSKMLPMLRQYVRDRLTSVTSSLLCKQIDAKLQNILMRAPYLPQANDTGADGGGAASHKRGDNPHDPSRRPVDRTPRVLSIVFGKRRAVYAAFVNREGIKVDHVCFNDIRATQREGAEVEARKNEEITQLKKFIHLHRPELIVLGINGPHYQYFFRDLTRYVGEVPNMNAHVTMSTLEGCTFGTNAGLDFDAQPEVSTCLALARKMQNPIAAFAHLVNRQGDFKILQLHPMQDYLDDALLRRTVERGFIRATALVGVNLHLAAQHQHLQAPLQFVSGLGPAKVRALLWTLEQSGVSTRAELAMRANIGPTVFRNCAGFLRIMDGENVLDSTRVHPENYDMAYQMAIDALEIDQIHQSRMNNYVVDAMKNPRKLDALDLEAHARESASNGRTVNRLLEQIRSELKNPFHERRLPYADTDNDTLFTVLTGESPEVLRVGQIVPVEVTKIMPSGVGVRLDSGLKGWIRIGDLSDSRTEDANDKVSVGMSLSARIVSVDREKFSVNLSTKTSDLQNHMNWEKYFPRDGYFQDNNERDPEEPPEERNMQIEDATSRAQNRARRFFRALDHPLWKNFTRSETTQFLETAPEGTGIFVPSSKGSNHMTLSFSWKANEVINIDIEEFDRPKQGAIGSRLRIRDTDYEDLDEINERFLSEILTYMNAVKKSPKFVDDEKEEEVEKRLRYEKAKRKDYTPYVVFHKPGTTRFTLGFLSGSNQSYFESIRVTPDGLFFRGQTFSSITRLLDFFKRNPRRDTMDHSARGLRTPGPPGTPAQSGSRYSSSSSGYKPQQSSSQSSSQSGGSYRPSSGAGAGTGSAGGYGGAMQPPPRQSYSSSGFSSSGFSNPPRRY
eukprot:comp22315_c0_seq2/m.53500 comp22315_c0_seq2/g.53500  ORF comp22315_c0_seq2/g.53500 comp22315_c0_seq2/m.53500 type:complete len:1617 (-) comp22315_c0_seq2:26-4876(-)